MYLYTLKDILEMNTERIPEWAKKLSIKNFVEYYDVLDVHDDDHEAADRWIEKNKFIFLFTDPNTGSRIYAKRK